MRPGCIILLVVLLAAGLGLSAGPGFGQSRLPADSTSEGRIAAQADTLKQGSLRKNPTGAMLRSMVVPGWGQWYNEKRLKAAVVMGAELGLVVDAIVQNQLAARSDYDYEREYYRNNRSLAIWWLGAAILYSMADAYVDAHLFDFDERPELTMGPGGGPGRNCVVTLNLALHF
jgi:hypothetical protein